MRHLDLVAVPPAAIRRSIPLAAWVETLETWNAIVRIYNRLNEVDFAVVCRTTNLARFLETFYSECANSEPLDTTLRGPQATELAHQCLTLITRAETAQLIQSLLQKLAFLESIAKCYARSAAVRALLRSIWSTHHRELANGLRQWQSSMIAMFESKEPVSALSALKDIAPLLFGSPEIAASLLTGSDLLESAQLCYTRTSDTSLQRAIVLLLYLSLIGLINIDRANPSLLSDHLYTLKALIASSNNYGPVNLLTDLVTNTPLLRRVQRYAEATKQDRLGAVVKDLRTFRAPDTARLNKRLPSVFGKEKAKAYLNSDLHIHRISLVTQIQDLFPDLGAGFILRLLDTYHNDVEEVTAHLLDESLPLELKEADKSEPAPVYDADRANVVDHFEPRSTPSPPPDLFVPHRHNAFDGDELDRLEVDASRLHIGKKQEVRADSTQPNKAAILAALAAFDSDDDERDDTYDIEDVGGTVDTADIDGDDAVTVQVDDTDIKLYKLYKAKPTDFGRSADTRRSEARAALKKETGMTDEAIEGWAIMLQREPKRARTLAFEASRFDGRQNDIAKTAYREGRSTDSDGSDNVDRPRSLTFRGRGRGRGGVAAGANNEPGTAAAKRRKEANKSSRANHNRRNQRARKMARGGFSGAG